MRIDAAPRYESSPALPSYRQRHSRYGRRRWMLHDGQSGNVDELMPLPMCCRQRAA